LALLYWDSFRLYGTFACDVASFGCHPQFAHPIGGSESMDVLRQLNIGCPYPLSGCTVAALAKAWTGVVADPGVCGDPSSCEAGYWLAFPDGLRRSRACKSVDRGRRDPGAFAGIHLLAKLATERLFLPSCTVAALAKAWTVAAANPGAFAGIHLLAKLATERLFLPSCAVAALAKAWTGVVADPGVCGDPSSCEAGYWLAFPDGLRRSRACKSVDRGRRDPGAFAGIHLLAKLATERLFLPSCTVAALAKAWTVAAANPGAFAGIHLLAKLATERLFLPSCTVAALAKAWTGVAADPGVYGDPSSCEAGYWLAFPAGLRRSRACKSVDRGRR
jgi:predicted small integral membrane protein